MKTEPQQWKNWTEHNSQIKMNNKTFINEQKIEMRKNKWNIVTLVNAS